MTFDAVHSLATNASQVYILYKIIYEEDWLPTLVVPALSVTAGLAAKYFGCEKIQKIALAIFTYSLYTIPAAITGKTAYNNFKERNLLTVSLAYYAAGGVVFVINGILDNLPFAN